MIPQDVEISDEVYVITAETAEDYKRSLSAPSGPVSSGNLFDPTGDQKPSVGSSASIAGTTRGDPENPSNPSTEKVATLRWSGEVPSQKWMNFYTKVLSRFATTKNLRLTVVVEASPDGGMSKQVLEETKTALRELGLRDDLSTS